MTKLLLLVAILTVLSGCGGGGGESQAQTEFKTLPANMRTAGGN